ncbi:hypothetical protein PUR71_11245 [Streptomyces sp. SP17BM10]|uniref:DUF6924 domain-containing protein n=1 Tax=Streptomyces sp. SP17BM10 TaxID=3002530 RepID=UPI002E76B14C|nr:hypothetical protein [Streptomyces sp. SP17BM10]MEE1783479.1 hypothetical protein [Streptomyces sp. SP17BM10]
MALPEATDLTSLVLRTAFGDDAAWEALRAAIDACAEGHATYVSDPAFDGADVQALVDADAAAGEDDKSCYLFLADAVATTGGEHLLLAVDLYDEPGRTFRVAPRSFADVSANLSIANMDFADYADAVDASGVFRGFDGG